MGGDDSTEPTGFPAGVEFLDEATIIDWTVRLRSGERGKAADGLARRILTDFVLRQTYGQKHSPAGLAWLCDGVGDLMDGKTPREALGLDRRRAGGQSDPRRWQFVALWLIEAESRGMDPAEAVRKAVEILEREGREVDLKTVEGYRRRAAKEGVERNPDADWAAYFGEAWIDPGIDPVKAWAEYLGEAWTDPDKVE
jgi:hypothetical protein